MDSKTAHSHNYAIRFSTLKVCVQITAPTNHSGECLECFICHFHVIIRDEMSLKLSLTLRCCYGSVETSLPLWSSFARSTELSQVSVNLSDIVCLQLLRKPKTEIISLFLVGLPTSVESVL